MQSKCFRQIYYEGVPDKGTSACGEFFNSYKKISDFMFLILNMILHIDNSSKMSRDIQLKLLELIPLEEEIIKEEIEGIKVRAESGSGVIDSFKIHLQFFYEIILARHIENYLVYLSSILNEIFIKRPETLKSSEKVEVETILSHSSLEGLIQSIAERKVNELSYKSIEDLNKYFTDKFNINIANPDEISIIIDAIETRNISVHNRCIVNKRYFSKTGKEDFEIGTLRKLSSEDLETFAKTIKNSVIGIDKRAVESLKLDCITFNQEI